MTRKNKKQLELKVKERKAFTHPYTLEKHSEFLKIVRNNKEDFIERNGSLFNFCWLMLSIGFGIIVPFIYKNGFEQIHTEEGVVKSFLLTFFSFVGFFFLGGLVVMSFYMGLELLKKRRIARKAGLLFPKFSLKRRMELLEKCYEDAKGPFSCDSKLLYEMFKSRYEDTVFNIAAHEISRIESRKKIQEFINGQKKSIKKLPETLKKTCEIISEKKQMVQGLRENFLEEREKRKIQELKEMKEQEKADIERMEKYLEKNSIDLRLDLRKDIENEKV